jgi:hypothetical protein
VSEDEAVTRASVEAEFPGWEAFQAVDRGWHARIRCESPPVIVHAVDLVDLREQIKRELSKTQAY